MIKVLRRCSDGYTFIELLLAITILGIVVVPFLGLFTGSFSAITLAGRQSCAVNLCREKMENIKAGGYAAVYDYYIEKGASPLHEENLAAGEGFWRITEVNVISGSVLGNNLPEIDLLQINITVYWLFRDQEYSETLESYLANR